MTANTTLSPQAKQGREKRDVRGDVQRMDELVVVPDKTETAFYSPTQPNNVDNGGEKWTEPKERKVSDTSNGDGKRRRIRIESFGMRLSTRRLPSLSEAELIERFIT